MPSITLRNLGWTLANFAIGTACPKGFRDMFDVASISRGLSSENGQGLHSEHLFGAAVIQDKKVEAA